MTAKLKEQIKVRDEIAETLGGMVEKRAKAFDWTSSASTKMANHVQDIKILRALDRLEEVSLGLILS